jgi:MoxR-like ATPase
MAVYHLACRIAFDGRQNPPARMAKYHGNCALPTCGKPIVKGDMISCTRDNENGKRKEPGTKPATVDHRESPDDRACERCGSVYSMRAISPLDGGKYVCEDVTACVERVAAGPEDTDTDESTETDPIDDTTVHTIAGGPASTGNVAMRALAKELAPYLSIKAGLDTAAVAREAHKAVASQIDGIIARVVAATEPKPLPVVVHAPHTDPVNVGVQHKQFPLLVKALASGCNVWVTGPAGSGKTTAVHNAAIALGKEYGYTGSCQDQYALTGYNDANGRYVRTPLRERYEHGGLFLWDEVDGSDPNALLAFNAMLANGTASFPDGMIKRHPDTLLAATANTFGLGGTHEYVGRNRLDAAFLDRFVFIDWQIDEALELATCANTAWVRRVQFIRGRVKAKGLKVLVTARASYFGAKLLAQDIDQDTVEAMTLRKGMSAEQWRGVDT